MDYLDTILGALVAWTAWKAGSRHARRKEQGRIPESPEPMCACTHSYGMHTEAGCQVAWIENVLVERGKPHTVKTGYNGAHHQVVYDHERYETRALTCACKRYTGPEPLPQYIP